MLAQWHPRRCERCFPRFARRQWYSGVERWAAVTDQGVISGFVAGPADTSEYWLAEPLLRWRADPTARPPDRRRPMS